MIKLNIYFTADFCFSQFYTGDFPSVTWVQKSYNYFDLSLLSSHFKKETRFIHYLSVTLPMMGTILSPLHSVWVSLGSRTNITKWWFQQQNFLLSKLRRPEVQDEGVGGACSLWRLWGGSPLDSSSFWWFLAFLCSWQYNSSHCLCLHMVLSLHPVLFS